MHNQYCVVVSGGVIKYKLSRYGFLTHLAALIEELAGLTLSEERAIFAKVALSPPDHTLIT